MSRLIDVVRPTTPAAVVLVLHGGASRSRSVLVSPAQLSVLRMVPIARRLARAGRGRLAVLRLLNTTRGWDTSHTPVDDAEWAMDQVRARWPHTPPIGLVGHSLGGRAALLAGTGAGVATVVALAPWVYADDDADLAGRRVLIVHGDSDRIAKPTRSAAVARTLGRRAEVSYVCVEGGKHAMLSHHDAYDGLAADFVTATLLGDRPGPTVERALAGERWQEV